MPHHDRRWYLRDDLRDLLKSKVLKEHGGDGYERVGKRIGVSKVTLQGLLTGRIRSSHVVPALCKLYGIDPLEYQSLDDEQFAWLGILDELKATGKDPTAVVKNLRALGVLPAEEAEPPKNDHPQRRRRARDPRE